MLRTNIYLKNLILLLLVLPVVFCKKILISLGKEVKDGISNLKGVIVWNTSNPLVAVEAQTLAKGAGAEVILADPVQAQQETLEIIRFAYSLWNNEELSDLVENSYAQFLRHSKR